MSLTSDAFIWLLRILLVVAVLWAVLRWNKAAGPGVLAILRRLVTLVVVSLLAILTVAAPLNAEYGWYSSFSDLLPGSDDQPAASSLKGESPAQAVAHRLPLDPNINGVRHRPTMALHLTPSNVGGYEDFTVPGPKSGISTTVTVWFPPSYTQPQNAHREYPVIEGFHGIKPAPYAFFNAFQFDSSIEQAVQAGRMREAIVVIPHWAYQGVDNECVDAPGGTKMETWLTQDVPSWVYSHLRAEPGRAAWSAFGMSAGGWCADMASMLHPSTYGTAISLGGYWRPDFDPPYIPFGPGSASWQHYDLVALAKRHPPAVALWTLGSRADQLSYPTTKKFLGSVRPPTSVTSLVLASGGHRTEVWTPHIPDALTWLGQASPAFAPGGSSTPSPAPTTLSPTPREQGTGPRSSSPSSTRTPGTHPAAGSTAVQEKRREA